MAGAAGIGAGLVRPRRAGTSPAGPGAVTFEIIFDEKAINRAAGFLADDPFPLREVLDAIDGLADDPRPPESFAFGSPDLRRLRAGRYRVLYRIEADAISVGHIARRPAD